ncbi:uncharacterized protein LOC121868119 [Homarus americanus]|nr:uncharacterized protein LOC121868119 [Homarus americanus]
MALKEWLWIPAVALVVLFTLVLCWKFFSDYTCCPCRRRTPEPVLPTHHQAHTTRPQHFWGTPSYVPGEIPSVGPSLPHYYTLSENDSPNLHMKFGDLPVTQVLTTDHGIPTLDLHNMTVREATRITNEFLRQSQHGHNMVKIVTGRGLHTEDGIPKVKPAIATLLNNLDYEFREVHKGGCFEVFLS